MGARRRVRVPEVKQREIHRYAGIGGTGKQTCSERAAQTKAVADGGEACEKVAMTAGLGHDSAEKGLAVLNRAEAEDPTAWAASLST
jgi:hypothetical protein